MSQIMTLEEMSRVYSGIEGTLLDYGSRNDASVWCLMHRTIRGKPITFTHPTNPYKHRPWQQEMLRDEHPNKCYEKGRQLGMSEIGVTESIHFTDVHNNCKSLYAFPRAHQMTDFVKTRINPIIDSSDYLKMRVNPDMNSLELKQIGSSYMLYRSAWDSAIGEGADVDMVSFDEYDRMKDQVELAFIEGMSSSPYARLRRFSTPTIPGRGVDLVYSKSDMRKYLWKCEHCGEWQEGGLSFEHNVIQVKPNGYNKVTEEIEPGTYIIGCRKCHKEINRMGTGVWVAEKPSVKDIRGYLISQLDAAWISADEIMKKYFAYRVKSVQLFYNYVIGQAYTNNGLIITNDDILNARHIPIIGHRDHARYQYICVGIDWGLFNWVVVMGVQKNGQVDLLNMFWVEDMKTQPLGQVDQIAALLAPYEPDIIVADAGYGADRNPHLLSKFPGRVFACDWDEYPDGTHFVASWNENQHTCNINRSAQLKKIMHSLKAKRYGIPEWSDKTAMYAKHTGNLRIMQCEDDKSHEVYEIVVRVGDDHLACATAYAQMGVDKLTEFGKSESGAFQFGF